MKQDNFKINIAVCIILLVFIISILIFSNKSNNETDKDNNLTKNYCSYENRKGSSCIQLYQPVCGWFNESTECIKYPCAQTYSNSCFACQDEKVDYWIDRECQN